MLFLIHLILWFGLLWFGVMLIHLGAGCVFEYRGSDRLIVAIAGVTISTAGIVLGGIAYQNLSVLFGG